MRTLLLIVLLAIPAAVCAQTYTASTLVSFPPISGTSPYYPGDVILDSKGNLYGTSSGGTSSGTLFPNGTVFEVSPSGVLTVLHYFNGSDGSDPRAGVTRDSAGNLYGTTFSGGAYQYYGTLYKLTPAGTETVLYSFPNKFPQGNYPAVNITLDGNGNLAGYTFFTDNNFNVSNGAIFQLANPDTFAVRFSFGTTNAEALGVGPVGQPLPDGSGGLYGATYSGGSGGSGTVFRLNPKGKTFKVLYSFNIFADKVYGPIGSPVMDSSGDLFGAGYGGIYEILSNGSEQAFYVEPKGTQLEPTLTLDAQGNLYGTTQGGGAYGYGALYRITPAGVETDLYSSDGPTLNDQVDIDQEGNLYVVEGRGGVNGTGAIIKLTKNAE